MIKITRVIIRAFQFSGGLWRLSGFANFGSGSSLLVSATIVVVLLTIIGRRASLFFNPDSLLFLLLLFLATTALLCKCAYGQYAKQHDHR